MPPQDALALYNRLRNLTIKCRSRGSLHYYKSYDNNSRRITVSFACFFAFYFRDPKPRGVAAEPWLPLPVGAVGWCVAVPDKLKCCSAPEIVMTNLIPLAVGATPEEALEKAEFEVAMAKLEEAHY